MELAYAMNTKAADSGARKGTFDAAAGNMTLLDAEPGQTYIIEKNSVLTAVWVDEAKNAEITIVSTEEKTTP